MIYQVLGLIGLLSIPILVATLYLQSRMVLHFYRCDQKRRVLVDQRSSIVNEIVVGMKHIKFNASEKILMEKVEKIRKKEKDYIGAMVRCLGINQAILLAQVPLTCLVCLLVYCVFYQTVSLTTAYSFTLYVTSVKTPLYFMEHTIESFSSMMVSFRRLQILYNKIEDYRMEDVKEGVLAGFIEFSNASFSWDYPRYEAITKELSALDEEVGTLADEAHDQEEDVHSELFKDRNLFKEPRICLKNINFVLKHGELCYLIGKVGSGKSSILGALLDLMNQVEGEISKNGSIAYIPQEAFMINDTIKNNILFGKKYNEGRYYRTLDICQLGPDLEILPAGDLTEIGERGINLSGGQKQRVAIARAVYFDSDIYLIDDCLSALDAEVGKAVLEKVILGELKDKTRLVVTHFYHHFKNNDRVLFMKNGEVQIDKNFQKIKQTKEFREYAKEQEENVDEEEKLNRKKILERQKSMSNFSNKSNPKSGKIDFETLKMILAEKEEKLIQGRLLREEGRKIGDISLRPYWFYFRNGTLAKFSTFMVLFVVSSLLLIFVNLSVGLHADGAKIPPSHIDYY